MLGIFGPKATKSSPGDDVEERDAREQFGKSDD